MSDPRLLDDLAARFSALLAASPARDVEKNARALLGGALARLDLVTREEFEVQRELLARARERLGQLEARIAELEAPAAPESAAQPVASSATSASSASAPTPKPGT